LPAAASCRGEGLFHEDRLAPCQQRFDRSRVMAGRRGHHITGKIGRQVGEAGGGRRPLLPGKELRRGIGIGHRHAGAELEQIAQDVAAPAAATDQADFEGGR
jgi:hypothetical protein